MAVKLNTSVKDQKSCLPAEMPSRSATARCPKSSSIAGLREENERLKDLRIVSMINCNVAQSECWNSLLFC